MRAYEKLIQIGSAGTVLLAGIGLGWIGNSLIQNENVDVSGPDTVHVQENGNSWIPANQLEVNYSRVSGGVEVQEVDYLAEVNGGSMRPAFWEGNTALLKEYSKEMSLQSGNVVLTDSGTMHTVVHNYLDSGGSIRIKGYNSESLDSVSEEEIDSVVLGVLYTKTEDDGGVSAYAKAK